YRDFAHASQLIRYLKERFSPCVGGAVYPEGRPDCSWQDNLRFVRIKREAGAEFFITQLFFENDHFFRFVEESSLGESVIPGILPIFGPRQLEMARKLAGAHVPKRLLDRLSRYRDDPESYRAAGLDYAAEQITGLVEAGFGFVHIFTLNRARDTARLLGMLGGLSSRNPRGSDAGDRASRGEDVASGEAH
ncbi:MAG: methylenetetrahydrofolate reductase, partial [Bacillota bacterium]